MGLRHGEGRARVSTPRSKVNLVAFDLGRVLIRLWDGWEAASQSMGISPPDGLRELDAAALEAVDEIAARYDTGVIDVHAFAREVAPYRGMLEADVVRLINVVLREPYAGTQRLIDDLHAAGVETACLSNTCEPHWSMMLAPEGPHSLPLAKMTHRFASHLVGLRKPDQRIYDYVERQSGYRGGEILFFDDLAANVDAAIAHGWLAHRIHSREDPIAEARAHLARADVI